MGNPSGGGVGQVVWVETVSSELLGLGLGLGLVRWLNRIEKVTQTVSEPGYSILILGLGFGFGSVRWYLKEVRAIQQIIVLESRRCRGWQDDWSDVVTPLCDHLRQYLRLFRGC